MRSGKTYSGDLMAKGKAGENIVIDWLRTCAKDVIDMREFRIAQRLDCDCGIETIDGKCQLAEIKTDAYIAKTGNFCFEVFRINHYVPDPEKVFYLGWAFRSPAKWLLVYSPNEKTVFKLAFSDIRCAIGNFVGDISNAGSKPNLVTVCTDNQKTTYNVIIPMSKIKHIIAKYAVADQHPNDVF